MIPDLKELKTLSTQESTGYRGSAKIQRQEGGSSSGEAPLNMRNLGHLEWAKKFETKGGGF